MIDHASPAEGADCWSNWVGISIRQNTCPRTPECSGIADRTSNQTYACNVKERAMEWNEHDDTERDGNRDSKSTHCEYAVHKYESGLLNL